MKKVWIIAGCVIAVIIVASCNRPRRNTGRAYMPDMAYSVAYETYAPTAERLKKSGANYTGKPVEGAIARGDYSAYTLKNDTNGYRMSAAVKSPLVPESFDIKEAERLYLVNCGICHGTKLDGNGPLYKDGKGPFTAMPKNLMGDDMKILPEGTMFHSITYGKNAMGSYASQLNTKQRWMVIAYIKAKQGGSTQPAGQPTDSLNAKTPPDSVKPTSAVKP